MYLSVNIFYFEICQTLINDCEISLGLTLNLAVKYVSVTFFPESPLNVGTPASLGSSLHANSPIETFSVFLNELLELFLPFN